mgnify:CR=1 FL=1
MFFRILLNEEITLAYPRQDMLRVSDGNWAEDEILRVTLLDDTILMEDASEVSEIFLLMEDGSQILNEQNVNGTGNLQDMIGQTITMASAVDLSIDPGGPYFGLGYPDITEATAVVDSVFQYGFNGEIFTEFSPTSIKPIPLLTTPRGGIISRFGNSFNSTNYWIPRMVF